MTTQTEALKRALEALQDLAYWDNGKPEYHEANKAITAIKEALAQPEPAIIGTYLEKDKEQEPVAWTLTKELTKRETTTRAHLWFTNPQNSNWTPLYTTPPQRKPLTDEQIKAIWLNGKDHGDDWLDVQGIARAIEAAHGIKE